MDLLDCSGFALLSRVVYFRGLHFLVYGHLPSLSCRWTVFCCCRLFFRFLPRAYRLRSNALGGGRVRVPDISKLTIKSSFTPFLRVYQTLFLPKTASETLLIPPSLNQCILGLRGQVLRARGPRRAAAARRMGPVRLRCGLRSVDRGFWKGDGQRLRRVTL